MTVRVYLAGPHEAREYRRQTAALLRAADLLPVDPMERPYYGDPDATVKADLVEILTCDFVLALFGAGATPGTSMEAFFARQHGIPVVSIVNVRVSPWIAWASEYVTAEYVSAVVWIAQAARAPCSRTA